MDYRYKNYGANKSWNKKEKAWALIQGRNPRMRPESESQIPIAIAHNKMAAKADKEGMSVEAYINNEFENMDFWQAHVLREWKKRQDLISQTNSYKSNNQIESIRFTREEQGGSRKKGGRTSWPRKMK